MGHEGDREQHPERVLPGDEEQVRAHAAEREEGDTQRPAEDPHVVAEHLDRHQGSSSQERV